MEDSDLFLDEPPVTQARAGAKFLPNVKRKAKIGSSRSIPSKPPEIVNGEAATTVASAAIGAVQAVEPHNVVEETNSSQVINPSQVAVTDSRSIPSKSPETVMDEAATTLPSAGIDAVRDVEPDNVVDESNSSQVINPSQVAVTDSLLLPEVAEPNNVADESNGSQIINLSQVAATDSLLPEAVSKDDANLSFGDVKLKMELLVQSLQTSAGENADLSFGLDCLDPLLTQSSSNDRDSLIDYGKTGTQFQGTRDFPDVDTQDIMLDTTIGSGRRAGKFKPKPRKQTSVLASPPAAVESIMHPPDAEFGPSETVLEEGSIPDFPTDHASNSEPMDLGSFIPPDPSISECPVNEKLANLAVASKSGAELSGNVPDVPREVSSDIMEKNASLVSNPSQNSKQSSTGDKVNGNGKTRKRLREKVTNPHIVDDLEDGTCDDVEYNAERASPKRRTSKRSKKPMNESEKPPRKRKTADDAQKQKKANEASDNPEKEPRKKFSHSTRRKRKLVDESLLNMPEEEIDFAKVALKDLILLADHKERLAKKEAQTLNVPLTDKSTEQTFNEENARDNERSIASEQDQGLTDDAVDYDLPIKKGNQIYNYQTYMKKEPRARWSKQDTQLFYEAIRQFGPDFSLIQQLFCGRSRHQIKLKFKNEERRSPFKLAEALASRSKDHSYYEKVIEQLQLVSGADPESHGDVSTDLTPEQEEITPKTNEEPANSKQDEDVAVGDQEADVAEYNSSLKPDEMEEEEEEEEEEIFSSYISAF